VSADSVVSNSSHTVQVIQMKVASYDPNITHTARSKGSRVAIFFVKFLLFISSFLQTKQG